MPINNPPAKQPILPVNTVKTQPSNQDAIPAFFNIFIALPILA